MTAYLLRRNFATHLKILGLDYPDIQYLLGHCIDDPYIDRPDYTDSKLFMLSKKMENRPLVNQPSGDHIAVRNNTEQTISGNKILDVDRNNGVIKLHIHALEKNDALRVKNLSENDNVVADFYEGYKPFETHRNIDVLKKYKSDYQ